MSASRIIRAASWIGASSWTVQGSGVITWLIVWDIGYLHLGLICTDTREDGIANDLAGPANSRRDPITPNLIRESAGSIPGFRIGAAGYPQP